MEFSIKTVSDGTKELYVDEKLIASGTQEEVLLIMNLIIERESMKEVAEDEERKRKAVRVMTRYIDADKIIEHLNDEIEGCKDCDECFRPVTYGTRLGLEYSKSLVETAETADVVRIVRCKDCIHRDPEDKKCDCSFQARGGMFPMDDNDFCSYGEKVKI